MINKRKLYTELNNMDGLDCGICKVSLEKEWALLDRWYKESRSKLFKRKSIDIDHIIPKSSIRGVDWWSNRENLQLTHSTCNAAKGNLSTPPSRDS